MAKYSLTVSMKAPDGTRFTILLSLLACTVHTLAAPIGHGYLVKAGNQKFIVERAITREQQRRGLMDRESMHASRGLLMIFDRDKRTPIWMKNMRFPIDVVWLSSDGLVVDLKTLPVCKESPCKVYYPVGPARFVLEVGAGLFPLNRGDKVEIIDASRDSLHPPVDRSEKHTD